MFCILSYPKIVPSLPAIKDALWADKRKQEARQRRQEARAKASQSRHTTNRLEPMRDWNSEFQALLKNGVLRMTREDIRKMSELGNDFTACAERYAK